MDEHGTAEAALAALPAMAAAAHVDRYAPCSEAAAEAEATAAARAGAAAIWLGDPLYPEALAQLSDAPPLLWCRGDPALLTAPCVAIVGARAASSLGERMARRLAGTLAEAGITVVSGLARGIDAAAHAAALPGQTAAVLAGGVDRPVPAETAALASRIAAEGGVLVSEREMGAAAAARDFPRRNRIVAGLSLGLVVIEAAARSGSLLTARLAAEAGREVMAVPGHPLEPRASGPNMLIRDGALLVRGAQDVIEAIERLAPRGRVPAARAAPPAPDDAVPDPPPPRDAPAPQDHAPAPRSGADVAQRRGPAGPSQAEGREGRERPAAALPLGPAPDGPRRDPPAPPPGDLRRALLDRLAQPVAEDALLRAMGLPVSAIAPVLLDLELDGRIERIAGGRLVAV